MLRGILVGLAACSLCVGLASGEEADPYDAKVRALAHPRYTEREKAARDLETAGEPALRALRAASTSSDLEVRERATGIAKRIERAALSRKLAVAPKISLELDKVPLQQAISQVAAKTGLQLQFTPAKNGDSKRLVTLKTGEVPFWQAIEAFYEAAGLTEDLVPKAPGFNEPMRMKAVVIDGRYSINAELNQPIRLTEGKPTAATDPGKAVRVQALPAGFGQNKFDAQSGELTLHLLAQPAPGASVREIVGIEVRNAVADDRRVLVPAYPPSLIAGGQFAGEILMAQQAMIVDVEGSVGPQSLSIPQPVTLKTGSVRPRQLAVLEGVVVARVMSPPEAIVTVADVFGKGMGQSQAADGLGVTAKSWLSAGGSVGSLRLKVVSTQENYNEQLNFPVQVRGRLRPFVRINRRSEVSPSNMEVQLKTSDGKLLKLISSRVTESYSDGVTSNQDLEVRFEKPADGLEGISLSLVGRRPATVEIPFTLKNVTLP